MKRATAGNQAHLRWILANPVLEADFNDFNDSTTLSMPVIEITISNPGCLWIGISTKRHSSRPGLSRSLRPMPSVSYWPKDETNHDVSVHTSYTYVIHHDVSVHTSYTSFLFIHHISVHTSYLVTAWQNELLDQLPPLVNVREFSSLRLHLPIRRHHLLLVVFIFRINLQSGSGHCNVSIQSQLVQLSFRRESLLFQCSTYSLHLSFRCESYSFQLPMPRVFSRFPLLQLRIFSVPPMQRDLPFGPLNDTKPQIVCSKWPTPQTWRSHLALFEFPIRMTSYRLHMTPAQQHCHVRHPSELKCLLPILLSITSRIELKF